jgi:hypothetical protein
VGDLQLQAIFVLALSLIGGVATYLQGVLVLNVKKGAARLLLDVLYSVLAGFGVWFLCVSGEVNIWNTLFCVLVSALNGADFLRASKQKVNAILGVGAK